MSEGVFPLIPSIYADNSLLTAVLVGVLLLFVLGELFGWPQSGLVVPGYLAGILVVAPEVAGLIALEALLTFALARLVIQWLPNKIPIDRAFGRDRFFIILLLSVVVRLWMEAGPGTGLLDSMGIGSQDSLHSVGLVLVPLTANALWMPGFFRGVPLVALPVLAVYLLLEFVLLPHTNLNLSHFAFATEGLSQDFLSTPRSYIILLVACAIAARMNLRFGWEFGGILVPGLLAIAWESPPKVAATLVEVFVMVLVLRIVLLLPPFRRLQLSAWRPLVLAFVLAYVLKMIIAGWLGGEYPGFRANELFGFGYLLPSLLVVRCWKRGSFSRILLPTTVVSLAGFLGGGFLAKGLAGFQANTHQQFDRALTESATPAWQAMVSGTVENLTSQDVDTDALQLAFDSMSEGIEGRLSELQVRQHPDGLVLSGTASVAVGRTWRRPTSANRLGLLVPGANTQAGLPEASVALVRLLDAEVLSLSPHPLVSESVVKRGPVLWVKSGDSSRLVVQGEMPADFDLTALRSIVPELEIKWSESGTERLQLQLQPRDVLRLALRHFRAEPEQGLLPLANPQAQPQPSTQHSTDYLAQLDLGVLQPLLAAQESHQEWSELAAWHARAIGIDLYENEDTFSLSPKQRGAGNSWTLWLRKGSTESVAIEVPTAGRHYRVLRVGRAWWEATRSRALLVHDAKSDPDLYELQRQGPSAPEVVLFRRLGLQSPGLQVFSVNAYTQYESPGTDAVLSDGIPRPPDAELPEGFADLQRLISRSGGNSRAYSAGANELRFHDSRNARRSAIRLTGGHSITAYLSPNFRLRFGALNDSPSLQATIATLDWPVAVDAFSSEWEQDVLPAEEAAQHFGSLQRSLKRYGDSAHPGELGRLKTELSKAGMSVRIQTEIQDGLPYLHASRGRLHFLAPLNNFQGLQWATTLRELREEGAALVWRVP